MTDDSGYFRPALWEVHGEKGTFTKHTIWKAGFSATTFYTVKFDDNGENPITYTIPLSRLNAVVINSYRQGSMGMSFGWGMGIRTYMPRTSNTVGAIKFFENSGETIATLTVDDPHGVISLFKTAKKEIVTQEKAYKFPAQRKAEAEAEKLKARSHLGTELSKLAKMLEKGELTKEEFENAKKRLLG